jgi:hypothetical protein
MIGLLGHDNKSEQVTMPTPARSREPAGRCTSVAWLGSASLDRGLARVNGRRPGNLLVGKGAAGFVVNRSMFAASEFMCQIP